MENEIPMPVKLLVALLAEHDITIDLGIALLMINTFRNEMYAPFFKQIFRIKSVLQEIIKRFL